MYVSAQALFWWGVATIRSQPLPLAFSKVLPQQVVTTGPYRILRHPFYVAYAATWLAGAIAINGIVPVGCCIYMVAQYIGAARAEHRMLLQGTLATSYADYLRRKSAARRRDSDLGLGAPKLRH